ncbi:hypothetical protein GCM10027568_00660 [Humibacter soli]
MAARRFVFGAVAVLAIAGGSAFTLGAAPAMADSLPAAGCRTNCVATFDTTGTHDLTLPTGLSSLTVTVAGSAGAALSPDVTNQPSVGGTGGVTTVTLDPATYGGAALQAGVGGTGEGSFLATSGGAALLAAAGGGGAAGYAAYLDLPGEILAVYPGGAGGAPSATGVAPGADATAFGPLAANGKGGTATGGAGGVGTTGNGGDGGSTTTTAPVVLAPGGTGGTFSLGEQTITAGAGGGGFTGGGGGAVERNVDNGDTPVDVIAPGGGGSGFLADSLTAVAGAGNTGTGFVTFTWSLPPVPTTPTPTPPATPAATVTTATASPALADTGSDVTLPIVLGGALLAGGLALVVVMRRRASR